MGLHFIQGKEIVSIQQADLDNGNHRLFPPLVTERSSRLTGENLRTIVSLNFHPNPEGYGGSIRTKTTEGIVAEDDSTILKNEITQTQYLAPRESTEIHRFGTFGGN